MQTIYCEKHSLNILVYDYNEVDLFMDNNEQKAVIFIDEKGNKQLKRFVVGKCDENCSTIQELLK